MLINVPFQLSVFITHERKSSQQILIIKLLIIFQYKKKKGEFIFLNNQRVGDDG